MIVFGMVLLLAGAGVLLGVFIGVWLRFSDEEEEHGPSTDFPEVPPWPGFRVVYAKPGAEREEGDG